MKTMKYKGYVGSLEISIEDNCLFGKVLGLSKACITYEGNTVVELQDDFHKSVDSTTVLPSYVIQALLNPRKA